MDIPGRHQDTTRTPVDAGPFSLADAAVRLGISPDAARKRLERGTLRGSKHNGRWQVYLDPDTLDMPASTGQDASLDRDRTLDAVANVVADAIRTPPDAGAVAELRALLAEERQRADRYLEAATIWQGRAMQLEERLKALEAGSTSQTSSEEAPRASEPARDAPIERHTAPDPLHPTEITLGLRVRRWLRRVMSQ
jgi:hypothetical protein